METIDKTTHTTMKWYHYVAAFCAGLFLTNGVPHFVNGISGNAFPTPFANPPGKGLSAPLINVLWALSNLLVGYLLFKFSKINSKNKLALLIFFAGVVLVSLVLSSSFTDKLKS